MGLLDWFNKGNARFTRFDDAYALTRPALWRSLQQTIQSSQHAEKSIWLIVHFTDTFSSLQTQLEAWQVDFEIVTQGVDVNQLERSGLLSLSKIKVVLADLIPETNAEVLLERDPNHTIAMIVVERHPLPARDQHLESFARSVPCRVEFGHYISLDDEVVRLVISETAIKILKQLGMNEHELIASSMVTRRLNKGLQRAAENYRSKEPAESAKQWLEINSIPGKQ